jgi:isochorismate synthase
MTVLAGLPATVSGQPETSGAELARALEPLLGRAAGRGRRTLVGLTLATAPRDPIDLYAAARALGETPAIWLRPADGFALVAIGSAWTARTSGPDRFRTAARAWVDLTDGAFIHDDANGSRGTGPLLLGGFPFAPDDLHRDPVWRGFERSALVLPRLLLTIGPDGAWLTANVVADGDTDDRDDRDESAAARARAVGELWDDLCAVSPAVPLTPAADQLRILGETPEAAWRSTVVRFAGAVGRGRVDKVVLARRVDVAADAPFDVPSALRRLEASAPESTIFAVTRRDRTFLGATPERLVRTEGREFRTVAMAGSIGRGADAAEDDRLASDLLASDKDREEHLVVVKMLREALESVAERLTVERVPSVVRLRHVQHLVTEVSGRLRERAGILALVERLHPTPAVGGQPRDVALELIDEQEKLDRGWYAGPLGWLDRKGDGEFVVALRSGVVDGATASLFAGCGIMADSDPGREWEESRMKLRSLASALGRFES